MPNRLYLNIFLVDTWEFQTLGFDDNFLTVLQLREQLAQKLKRKLIEVARLFKVPPGKITLPDDVDLDSLHQAIPSSSIQPLKRSGNLRSQFGEDLSPDELHLVVRSDIIERINVFRLDTKTLHIVWGLQQRNKTLQLVPEGIKLADATFYMPPPYPIACDDDEVASIPRESLRNIVVTKSLSTLYEWGFPPDQVHFFVRISSPPIEESRDRVPELPFTQQRKQYFNNIKTFKSPSSESEPKTPASLFNKTLCRFRHHLTTAQPTAEDIKCFQILRERLTDTFTSEDLRRDTIINILTIGGIVPPDHELSHRSIDGTNYRNDGDLRVILSFVKFLFYIQEIKNEACGTKSEPFFEAIQCC